MAVTYGVTCVERGQQHHKNSKCSKLVDLLVAAVLCELVDMLLDEVDMIMHFMISACV